MITAYESKRAIIAIHKAITSRRTADVFVFIGGGIVPLLITDPAAATARPTKDVDIVFEIASVGEYSNLRGTLLNAGFVDDQTIDKPACALHFGEWRVDVLSTLPNVVDGGNRWFHHAVKFAEPMDLDGLTVFRASAPVFIATKVEAWVSRGKSKSGAPDYYHQDIEDIIAVIDGRPELDEEWATAPRDVIQFVGIMFYDFLQSEAFLNALPGHLSGDDERAIIFIGRVESHLLSLL